jgi:L-threonylcarbamoyladenylate synthase
MKKTKVVKIDRLNPEKKLILSAVRALKRGGLIIFPTETVYGLGCDPDNTAALKKMFAAKKRSLAKPFQLLVSSIKEAKSCSGKIPASAAKMMKEKWPGPLTLVVKKNPSVSDILTAGLSTVGLRMPDHPVAIEIIKAFGRPIAATSANISGKKAPGTVKEAIKGLEEFVGVALDAGKAEFGSASKVVDVSLDKLRLLRK